MSIDDILNEAGLTKCGFSYLFTGKADLDDELRQTSLAKKQPVIRKVD